MRQWRFIASATQVIAVGACGWTESAGDFNYSCIRGGGMFDGPSCEHRLTERYSLRYGEGSGDNIILTYESHGRAPLIQGLGDDLITKIALDDRLLVMETADGRFFVAPAHAERWPELVGPLSVEEFRSRYPDVDEWRNVQ